MNLFLYFHFSVTKPLQSGHTELASVSEMPGVFCKYINLQTENFIPKDLSPLKVLLSVSWDQKNFTNANDASATWSEDVQMVSKLVYLWLEDIKTQISNPNHSFIGVFSRKKCLRILKRLQLGQQR